MVRAMLIAWLSSLPFAASHGWMAKPLAVQPGATGLDLKGVSGTWYRDHASWYTHDTSSDNQPRDDKGGNRPAKYPGRAQIIASCGIHRSNNSDDSCGKVNDFGKKLWDRKCHVWDKKDPHFGEERFCDARQYMINAPVQETWHAGGHAEVAHVLNGNHGGVVGYRLCPLETVMNALGLPRSYGRGGETEECFQAGHLEFAGAKTCVRCPNDPKGNNERCYKATDVVGRKNYIYRSWDNFLKNCTHGEDPHDYCTNPDKNALCTAHGNNPAFSLVNKVKVPAGLSGKYVVGFRWDSAHTWQVWQNCAIVNIVANSAVEVV